MIETTTTKDEKNIEIIKQYVFPFMKSGKFRGDTYVVFPHMSREMYNIIMNALRGIK
jgi:hypothetical protein